MPFLYTNVEHNLFFLALFKPIILQFFTILQDKLHSLNIQDDLSTRFLWAKNYRLGQPHYKTFSWREFSIIPELFCRNSLLLCDMQGNNYGLSGSENDQKILKSPVYTASRKGSDFYQAPNLQPELSEPFEWTLIELGRLQHGKELIKFRFYFPIFNYGFVMCYL